MSGSRPWQVRSGVQFLALGMLLVSMPPVLAAEPSAEAEGRRIAAEMRSLRPTGSFTNTAVLKIRDARARRTEIPVVVSTEAGGTNWHVHYQLERRVAGQSRFEAFTVTRGTDSPPAYSLRTAGPNPALTDALPAAPMPKFSTSVGGSDFSLGDLGLEFLYWPGQRLLRKEQRRSQACYVLESVNPRVDDAYSRVVSWVDIDTLGIVHADAYDTRKKLVKVFEPKRFEKIDGQWQIKELEIRNEQTDSRTSLVFDFPVK